MAIKMLCKIIIYNFEIIQNDLNKKKIVNSCDTNWWVSLNNFVEL